MSKIGRHVAEKIRSIKADLRTPEQEAMLSDYIAEKMPTEAQRTARKAYSKEVFNPTPKKIREGVTYDELFFAFEREFKNETGVELSRDRERLEDYKTVLCYFAKDERFFKCDRLTNKSVPSFDKGLLIVGGYGNGKSTIMKCVQRALRSFYTQQFRFHTANSVVDEFESCEDASHKKAFWKTFSTGAKCFDDVKTERDASNYGKYNLFKDIIERRYDEGIKTFLTCNYKAGHIGDLDQALRELGERYEGRVFDRIFEMFNIIEFKGKSFRK